MPKKSAKQEDLDALVEEVGRLETLLLRVTHAIRNLAQGQDTLWNVLDRLTGKKPGTLHEPHVHQWRKIRPAVFTGAAGGAIAEGVTESCACGATRTHATAWGVGEEYVA